MQTSKKRSVTVGVLALTVGVLLLWRSNDRSSGEAANAAPTRVSEEKSTTRTMSMSEVLDMAVAARRHMAETLDDYSARFVKQEVDTSGTLGGVTEMFMKVQTRLRGDTESAPKRVYLRFDAPDINLQG